MQYSATLSTKEAEKFFSDFYFLKISRLTDVESGPDKEYKYINVVLKPHKVSEELLKASFKDGMLYEWGWSKKFKMAH